MCVATVSQSIDIGQPNNNTWLKHVLHLQNKRDCGWR